MEYPFILTFSFFFSFIFAFSMVSTILWIFMLVDAAKRDFPNSNDKLLWILILVFGGSIGAIIYYVLVKSKSPVGTGIATPISTIITASLLAVSPFSMFAGVAGIILMWFWTKWSSNLKIVLTILSILAMLAFYGLIVLLMISTSQSQSLVGVASLLS